MKLKAFLLISLLGLSLIGCGDEGEELGLSYQIPLVPLKITVDQLGKISLSASYSVVTPIGTFDLSAGRSITTIRGERDYPVLIVKIDNRADVYRLEPNNPFEIDFQENDFYRIVTLEREEDGDLILVLESQAAASTDTSALDFMLEPSFGYEVLSDGFEPNPYHVELISGGAVDVNRLVAGNCYGYAATAPDFDLYWDGSGALSFYFEADSLEADTTLIINDPDGNWLCNDDTQGLNPEIALESAKPGLYDIWIGSYAFEEVAFGTLWIMELE